MNFERGIDPHKSLRIGQLELAWKNIQKEYGVDPELFEPISCEKYKGWDIIIIKQTLQCSEVYNNDSSYPYIGVINRKEDEHYYETNWACNPSKAINESYEIVKDPSNSSSYFP